MNEMCIFQCMGEIFCVEFQRASLKFHSKYLIHTLKDMIFIQCWNFKSFNIEELIGIFETPPGQSHSYITNHFYFLLILSQNSDFISYGMHLHRIYILSSKFIVVTFAVLFRNWLFSKRKPLVGLHLKHGIRICCKIGSCTGSVTLV